MLFQCAIRLKYASRFGEIMTIISIFVKISNSKPINPIAQRKELPSSEGK
jgi:hypothetical protein